KGVTTACANRTLPREECSHLGSDSTYWQMAYLACRTCSTGSTGSRRWSRMMVHRPSSTCSPAPLTSTTTTPTSGGDERVLRTEGRAESLPHDLLGLGLETRVLRVQLRCHVSGAPRSRTPRRRAGRGRHRPRHRRAACRRR